MKICAISDIHGNLVNDIPKCDVLCICGDIVNLKDQRNLKSSAEWWKTSFIKWINDLPCNKVIITPGNHDFYIENEYKNNYDSLKKMFKELSNDKLIILIDESYEYNKIKFYGTPWIVPIKFQEHKWAFDSNIKKLLEIPKDIDILITHDSPFKNNYLKEYENNKEFYHFYGHWHDDDNAQCLPFTENKKRYNCSILNNYYNLKKEPYVIVNIGMKEMVIDIPYYEDMTRISNSNIGWYLKYGPAYLRDMLDGKEEGLKTKALDNGTMIHEYILQPDEFWKDYIILDFETPKVKQQKDFCDFYVSNKKVNPLSLDDEILLNAYNSAYNNSKPDDKKLDEAKKLIETYSKYIEYLNKKDDKKIISFADLNKLKRIKENITKHKKANELLFALPDTFETHNEFQINWDVNKKDYHVKCKSLLDRVCFDHVNKKIILIDLKTTSNLYDFKHSVETYDYYRQLAYYGLAIQWYMQEILNLNSKDYDLEMYIIGIDTASGRNEIKVFNMLNEDVLTEKIDLINNTLQKIAYHISTNQWEHSPEYYNGDGIERL